MDFLLFLFGVFSFISWVVSISIFIVLKDRLKEYLVSVFLVLMFLISLWNLFAFFELLFKNPYYTILFGKLCYISVSFVPVFLFLFVLLYSNKPIKYPFLLFIFPAVSLYFVFLNVGHLFFSKESIILLSTGRTLSNFERGPLFWIFALYSYSLILFSCGFIIRKIFNGDYIKKRQGVVLLIGVLIPFLGNVLYILFASKFVYDISPLLLVATQVLYVWNIRNYNFLDIVLFAYERLFNRLNEALIVVDDKGRIVKYNKKAIEFLDLSKPSISEALKVKLKERCFKFKGRHYSLKVDDIPFGKIIIITDITEIKEAYDEKMKAKEKQIISNLRNEFLMRISHELRRPLFPIIGYLSESISKVRSKDVKNYLSKALVNASQLKVLVNRAINFLSFQMDKSQKVNVRLDLLIRDVVLKYKREMSPSKDILLELEEIKITTDPIKLREIIFNLLDNAVKYGKGFVKIKCYKKKKIYIDFINDGKFPRNILSEINKGTYMPKLDPELLKKGIGIGLLLVKLLLRPIKGRLSILNKTSYVIVRVALEDLSSQRT